MPVVIQICIFVLEEYEYCTVCLRNCIFTCSTKAYCIIVVEDLQAVWQVLSSGRLPDSFVKGLQLTKWAGRAEVIHDPSGRLSFYLDGAHSPESMEACANWFCSTIKSEGNSKVAEPNNTSQLSILDTDDKWNSRGTMVRRVRFSVLIKLLGYGFRQR